MTPERIARYLRWAAEAALDSKDTTKVGAVLISPEGIRLLSCYNGPPIGVQDSAARRVAPEKYAWASHAEQNAIAFAARKGVRTEGLTMAVTHWPCLKHNCVHAIIQAGIASLVVGGGSAVMALDDEGRGAAMFKEAGVRIFVP